MIIFAITLMILLVLRVPIGFCLMLSPFAYILMSGDIPFRIITQRLESGAENFTLLAVPFFIIAGKLMNAGGITDRIFNFAKAIVGHIPGGLAHANVLASIFFSGMSGSAIADAGGLGTIEIQALKKDGYTLRFSAAITAASSTIGPIIPPSIPIIVYAVFAETSVAALFAAGLIPGLLMGVALMVMIYIYSIKFHYPKHVRANLKTLWDSFVSALPPLITPLILVGGILGGVFTPTEAGAAAAVYALFLGFFVYRIVDLKKVGEVFLDSSYTTATVMLIVMGASLFGWVLTLERIPVIVGTFILSLTESKILILAIANLFLLFVGCFLEPVAAMIILIPVFLPICQQLEISLVHFGIIMVLNLMIGLLTPPVGLVLYVVSDIAKISFEEVVRGTLPFLIPLIIVLILLTYLPIVVLILPMVLNLC